MAITIALYAGYTVVALVVGYLLYMRYEAVRYDEWLREMPLRRGETAPWRRERNTEEEIFYFLAAIFWPITIIVWPLRSKMRKQKE